MSTSYFQGGDFVELLSAQGKAPAAQWKLQGKITKSFEKLIKGNAFLLDGSADTRMQLPKGGASSTNATASLGLTQRFLVLQLLVPFTKSFSLEIGFSDHQRARRRFVISSAFREPTVTALHAQIPLGAAAISRDSWINLVLDLQALTDTFFAGSVFRSMESLAIGGSCRLKRVFTMKDPPTPSGCVGDNNTADIPRQFVFSSGKEGMPAATEYFAVQGQCGGAVDVKPASDAGARDKKTGSAGPGLVKGKSLAVGERRVTPDPKKRSNVGSAEGVKRPGALSSRGGKSSAPSRGIPRTGATSDEGEGASEAVVKKEAAPLRAAKAVPRETRKVQEARSGTPTPDLDVSLVLPPPSRQSSSNGSTSHETSPGRDRAELRTSREQSNRSPDLRPASVVSTRSSVSARSSASFQHRASTVSGDELDEVPAEKSVDARDRSTSRPTSSSGGSRQEIMSEIQQKLDLLADEDQRATDRNHELFLRHTTLIEHLDLDLSDSSAQTIAEDIAACGQPSRKAMGIGDRDSRNHRDASPSVNARAHSSTSSNGLGLVRGPKASIFEFSSGSSVHEAAPSRSSSSISMSQAGEMPATPAVSSKLFDFDALLDAIDSPAGKADPVAAAPIDSPMESSRRFDPVDEGMNGDAEESADSGSDHELELLLAAKRAARRKEQKQQLVEHVRRSASTPVDPGLKTSSSELGGRHLPDGSSQGIGGKERASASVWSFGDRVSSACNAEEVAEDGGDVTGDHGDDSVGGNEDSAVRDDQAARDACENDTGSQCSRQDHLDDDDDADLSIDLTGELEDLDQVGGGQGGAPSSSPNDGRAAHGATRSPMKSLRPGTASHMSASHASALSTSFDFGDLVEDGEAVEKQGAPGHTPLQSSSMLLPPTSASFDFGDLTDGSKSPSATASPMVAGESSTAKRLQRLLESTEWRSLSAPAPERSSQRRHDRVDPQPLVSSSSSPVPPSPASRNSIELVYDPVLRCYYDPVADKYYALAK